MQIKRAKLIKRLSVFEEILINKKGFCTFVCRSEELTLKPLGSSPKKRKSP